MRKEMDLEVMDRIIINYEGSHKVKTALESFNEFVCIETLSNRIETQINIEGTNWNLNGELCRISILKSK